MKKLIACTIMCLFSLNALIVNAIEAKKIIDTYGHPGGLFVIIGCGDKSAPKLAVDLGNSGDYIIQCVASTPEELQAFQQAIAKQKVKGLVTAELLDLKELDYRNDLINVLVIMDPAKAAAAGLTDAKAMQFVAPLGKLVAGDKIIDKPMPKEMDSWTHHRYNASGNPFSNDKVIDLPVGYRWNAGLPMNFNNPVRGSNRYSATRGIALNDGKCLTITESTVENLGPNYRAKYGTDQYLNCRDAFNGLLLWRKKIGGTFYGGLYIENRAPFASVGDHVYIAGDNDKLLVIDIKTGKTIKELDTKFIPGVILVENGVIVSANWKEGKVLGPIKNYDRRRMDWDIGEGTIEAYDVKTLAPLWKKDLLGTSMRIADGKVYFINRSEPDALEKAHNKPKPVKKGPAAKIAKGGVSGEEAAAEEKPLTHPTQKVVAVDLKNGKTLWEVTDIDLEIPNKALRVVSALDNRVIVSSGLNGESLLLSGDDGKLITKLPQGLPVITDGAVNYGSGKYDLKTGQKQKGRGLKETRHICTPVTYVNGMTVNNRGGWISGKDGKGVLYGGVRGGCITGSIPAYGSLYSPQNWCRCSPAQIAGLISIGPIGTLPTPQSMERSSSILKTDQKVTDSSGEIYWPMARGNAERGNSADFDIPTAEPKIAWEQQLTDPNKTGLAARDWHSFLNSRITPAVIGCGVSVVCDIDQNEVIAVDNKTGQVKWRYQTAGRSSASPTLYKGICLVGDHAGYVYALDAASGKLIYRLQIAPKTTKMLSYGKVESVWPVIAGVMITDDLAYASAGRSQGSDGGLVIRAFKPETGQIVWSKVLTQDKNNKQIRINDMLVKHDKTVQLMFNRFDLTTGEQVENPNLAYNSVKNQLQRMQKNPEKKKELEEKLATLKPDITVNCGVEGIYSWNWTRLGDRKFGMIGLGSAKGYCLAWNKDFAATERGGNISLIPMSEVENETGKHGKPAAGARAPAGCFVTSLVLCKNALLCGGTISKDGKDEAVVQALDFKTGKLLWEKKFDGQLAFNGLAIAPGEVVVSLDSGKLVCLK